MSEMSFWKRGMAYANLFPNSVHVHTHSDSVSDYLHRARVLYLRNAFPPLQQQLIFRRAENTALKHTMNVHFKN